MPVRRMRCNGCGQARDNFSKLQQNASPSERLCTDCESSATKPSNVAPPAPAPAQRHQQQRASTNPIVHAPPAPPVQQQQAPPPPPAAAVPQHHNEEDEEDDVDGAQYDEGEAAPASAQKGGQQEQQGMRVYVNIDRPDDCGIFLTWSGKDGSKGNITFRDYMVMEVHGTYEITDGDADSDLVVAVNWHKKIRYQEVPKTKEVEVFEEDINVDEVIALEVGGRTQFEWNRLKFRLDDQ